MGGGEFPSTVSHTFGSCGGTPPTNPPTFTPTIAPTIPPTAAPTAPTGGDWNLIYKNDFETDQGIFMGTNKRFEPYSYPDGTWSLRIRRTSKLKSEWVDFPGYSQLSFKFWMYATGMEVGDNFFFNVRFNGEQTFTLVKDYVRGTDFVNKQWVEKTILIDVPAGKTSIQLKFKGDSDKGNDQVYIDQVLLEGK